MCETGIYGLSEKKKKKNTKLATLGMYSSKLLDPTDRTGWACIARKQGQYQRKQWLIWEVTAGETRRGESQLKDVL